MPFNGPGRELVNTNYRGEIVPGADIDDEKVYCCDCGTIYVTARGRDCPACTLAEMVREISGDR